MAQTPEGAMKARAKALGMTLVDYKGMLAAGQKWCTGCKAWHAREQFGVDRTRSDGLASACLDSRHTGNPRGWAGRPRINPLSGRPGPMAKPRDGDRLQARACVNRMVRTGRLPRPDAMVCVDFGSRARIYDHYLGYAAEHHVDVEPVCDNCDGVRRSSRGEYNPHRDGEGKFTNG